MTIILPDTPGPVDLRWSPLDFGGWLTPPLGGAEQRLNRLGNRWSVEVSLPPMLPRVGMGWAADLNAGLLAGAVRWRIRQPGFHPGSPGVPRVAGAGQAGSTLALDGLQPRYVWTKGQMITVITGGRRYVYQVAAGGVADGAGAGTMAITPPLRAEPADNDVIEIGAPFIEGKVTGDSASWTVGTAQHFGLAFSVTETA